MTSFRRERVAEMVRGFLGQELSRLSDPRLHRITVTDVEMSPDLKFAKVYWTAHAMGVVEGSEPHETTADEIREGEKALKGVAALLRRRIGEELELRYLPELQFRFDESIDRGMRIDYLLHKVQR